MGYHADVFTGVKALIEAAVSVPVLSHLDKIEAYTERYPAFIVVVRVGIEYEASPVIGQAGPQYETWTWDFYVCGGGGASRDAGKATHVDTLLETIRTGITQTKPESVNCGRLNIVSETYDSHHGASVIYKQTWTHDRMDG